MLYDYLLWSRVCAMRVETYRQDLKLIKDSYETRHFTRKPSCMKNQI